MESESTALFSLSWRSQFKRVQKHTQKQTFPLKRQHKNKIIKMFFFQEGPISGCFPGRHQKGPKISCFGFYIYFFFELEHHFHRPLSLTASLMRQKMTVWKTKSEKWTQSYSRVYFQWTHRCSKLLLGMFQNVQSLNKSSGNRQKTVTTTKNKIFPVKSWIRKFLQLFICISTILEAKQCSVLTKKVTNSHGFLPEFCGFQCFVAAFLARLTASEQRAAVNVVSWRRWMLGSIAVSAPSKRYQTLFSF